MIHGRRRDLGLGAYPLVPLAEARRLAAEYRRRARSGGDPAQDRATPAVPTVREAVEAATVARRAGWRNQATERKWLRHFETFVFPQIGDRPVSDIGPDDISRIVVPLWQGRGSIGYVVRQNLAYVMRWAIGHDHRRDNPVDAVTALLPKVKPRIVHRPSLEYPRIRAAMAVVLNASADDAVKLLVVFQTLCASRPGEAAGACWSEIDTTARVWSVPAERMKAHAVHHVPLSDQALRVLERARKLERGGRWVFARLDRHGAPRPVPPTAPRALLRVLNLTAADGRVVVPHGFRATFRTWGMNEDKASTEQLEAALAHVQTDPTVAAYARSDLLKPRRGLMQRWADYVLPRSAANVGVLR